MQVVEANFKRMEQAHNEMHTRAQETRHTNEMLFVDKAYLSKQVGSDMHEFIGWGCLSGGYACIVSICCLPFLQNVSKMSLLETGAPHTHSSCLSQVNAYH